MTDPTYPLLNDPLISLTLQLTLDESQEVLRALKQFRQDEATRKEAVEVLDRETRQRLTPEELAEARRNKIGAIKMIRERLQLGLKESKDLVETEVGPLFPKL